MPSPLDAGLSVAPQIRKQFRHLSRRMRFILGPGDLNAIPQDTTSFVNMIPLNLLLGGHQEGGNVGRCVIHQATKEFQSPFDVTFFDQFHGQTVPQEGVLRIIDQHRLNPFSP